MNGSGLAIFSGLSRSEVLAARIHFREVEVGPGVTLFRVGDIDASMVCVMSGLVRVSVGDTVLAELGPEAIIGEMALFSPDGSRTASATTATPAKLLLLDRYGYDALRAARSRVATNIERHALRAMVRRLAKADARIASVAEGTPVERTVPPRSFFARILELFGAGGSGGSVSLDVLDVLRNSVLFEGAAEGELQAIASFCEPVAYRSGHVLCTEGEPGIEMFVLADGAVDVLIATEGSTKLVECVATLEAGDCFGIVALVLDLPRTASCVAKGPVQLLRITRDVWEELQDEHSDVGSTMRTAMIRTLIEQLNLANDAVSRLDQGGRKSAWDLRPLLEASSALAATRREGAAD